MQIPRRPTYADISRVAGVSQTTVSFVLKGRASEMSIPESTCRRVLDAASGLGYRPNRFAAGQTQTIGVLVPQLESSFFAQIVYGVQDVAEDRGSRLLLVYSRHDPVREARQVELLLEHRVDALICVVDEFTASCVGSWIKSVPSHVPLVLVDEASRAGLADCVVADDESGIFQAMRHLVKGGHQRIGHIAGPTAHSSTSTRLAAYKGALVEARIPYDARMVVADHEHLLREIRGLFAEPEPPTAVVAANDVRAALTYEVLQELARDKPVAAEIIGFGNAEVSRRLGLSTIDQNPLEMGRLAAQRVFSRIEQPSLPREVLKAPVQLLLRDGAPQPTYSPA